MKYSDPLVLNYLEAIAEAHRHAKALENHLRMKTKTDEELTLWKSIKQLREGIYQVNENIQSATK